LWPEEALIQRILESLFKETIVKLFGIEPKVAIERILVTWNKLWWNLVVLPKLGVDSMVERNQYKI